jgi:hypothetical protein
MSGKCPNCENGSGYVRRVGRDNDEIVEDCPDHQPSVIQQRDQARSDVMALEWIMTKLLAVWERHAEDPEEHDAIRYARAHLAARERRPAAEPP